MKEIYLNIQNFDDRKTVVWALVNAGHKVRIKEEKSSSSLDVTYWVIVELPDLNIKSV